MKKGRLKLKERDYIIVKHIYEYRFLSGELLWYLLRIESQSASIMYSRAKDGKSRPKEYGFKLQALSKRLKQLYDAKYVERHYLTDQPYGRGYGSPRAIYGLGRHSAKPLYEIYQIPHHIVRKIVESNKVKSPYLRHALELATFRIILELACQQSKGKVVLLLWEEGISLKDYVYCVDDKSVKNRIIVCPDAFFGLEIHGIGKRHFFLEIDRGTEPIVSNANRSNIRRKLLGYQYYHKSKKILDKYDYRINGFQVLFVTTGNIESDNRQSGRIANILNELLNNTKLNSSKSLFLLTTPDLLYLDSPESVFEKIWISSNIRNLLSLLK